MRLVADAQLFRNISRRRLSQGLLPDMELLKVKGLR